MLIYFFIIFLLYYIFIALFSMGWNRNKASISHENQASLPFVSVVIAVRNEEKNILKLLDCLTDQSYPKDQFEVIIVDDHSEDSTVKKLQNFMKSKRFLLSLIRSDFQENSSFSPKKHALVKGISAAKGEIILTTDGDCWFDENWIKSMIIPFQQKQIQFVSGPVALDGESTFISKIQSVEFASLIGSGAALINLNYPLMCNGANIAFRKSAFYEVNGYEGNLKNASGDDVFLMQKINKKHQKSIEFVKDSEAVVTTLPQKNITDLISQRRRWASKWNKHLVPVSWAIPLFLFIHYFSVIVAIGYFIIGFKSFWPVIIFLFLKFLFDYLFLKKVMKFCNLQIGILHFATAEILYPFYAIFFGIAAQFGRYQWKGRSHKI